MPTNNYSTLWLLLAVKVPEKKSNSFKSPWKTLAWFDRFKLGDLPADASSKTLGLANPEAIAAFFSSVSNLPEAKRLDFIERGGDCAAGRAAYKLWFRHISKATNTLIDSLLLDCQSHPQQLMASGNTDEWPDFSQIAGNANSQVAEGLYGDIFLRGLQVDPDVNSVIKSFIIITGNRLKKAWSKSIPAYAEMKVALETSLAGMFWLCFCFLHLKQPYPRYQNSGYHNTSAH